MTAVDPMAGKYRGVTPYNYAFNTPVRLNDPSGADPFNWNFDMTTEQFVQSTDWLSGDPMARAQRYEDSYAVNHVIDWGSMRTGMTGAQHDAIAAEERRQREENGGKTDAELVAEIWAGIRVGLGSDLIAGATWTQSTGWEFNFKPQSLSLPDVNFSGTNNFGLNISARTIASSNFESPTGFGIRQQDGHGAGHWHASRDRGDRLHEGLDFVTQVGQQIISPVGGTLRYIQGARYPRVDITPSPGVGIEMIRILYVNAPAGALLNTNYQVTGGDSIGTAADLTNFGYAPTMTPHVHVQFRINGQWSDPTPYFFGPNN
jgi:murein DD-endopeptidase MepM/ murein hydrolase activator NlpD